jgi:hypothetical protein
MALIQVMFARASLVQLENTLPTHSKHGHGGSTMVNCKLSTGNHAPDARCEFAACARLTRKAGAPVLRAKTFVNCRKILRAYLFATLLLVAACSSAASETCSRIDSLDNKAWYQKHMEAAGVRPLCATNSAAVERYRLTWLRSFHNPIVVTLERNGASIEVTAIRLDGAGGYEPGKIVEKRARYLSMDEFREFSTSLHKMDFWTLKTLDQLRREAASESDAIIVGADGARWILEGATEKFAHCADRWSDASGPFIDTALFLLRKSGVYINGPIY